GVSAVEGRGPVSCPFAAMKLGDMSVPLWVVPLDEHGTCTGPETWMRLVDELKRGSYTDVFVFSHGWNNDFERAKDRYERFITGYHNLVRSNRLEQPLPYKPLLVGVYWPSIDLLLPWEEAPQIAAGSG